MYTRCQTGCVPTQHKGQLQHQAQGPACVQVELVFLMLSILTERSLVDYTFLKQFYLDEVATYPALCKTQLMLFFLDFFNQRASQEVQVQALQTLLLPSLICSFTDGEAIEILSLDITSAIINNLLCGEMSMTAEEALRVELLKLATLLIEHVPDLFVE
jgi:transformation/transcription domain-associated protein